MEEIPVDRIAPNFADVLQENGFAFLEGSPDPSFALDSSMYLTYVNPAYLTFGCANGGLSVSNSFTGIGTFIGDFMREPLRQFYLNAYGMVIKDDKTWKHEYDCSSPNLYRRYLQSSFPLKGKGLVVINHLIEERAHKTPSASPIKAHYLNDKQLIAQCSHCRKIRRQGIEAQWDWVAEWIAQPPEEVTHSLCEACTDYYYNDLQSTLAHPQ